MAEYIDKQAALAELNKTYDKMAGFHPQFYNGYQFALNQLSELPTADVAEVRHGRWVDKMVRDWHCSECGKKVPKRVHFDGYCYADKLNYCPNCGARMDGRC